MKTHPSIRFWAPAVLLGAVSFAPHVSSAQVQTPVGQSAVQSLLDRAHALELRGRMDMAAQTWNQVLLNDPKNTEALGGLARAAKLEGKNDLAASYIERLRAVNPNDPGIARAESAQIQQDHNTQLQQAGKLAQAGDYDGAMKVYHQVYGEIPPPGDGALAYYETEAATQNGRPHAISGLQKLSQQFPGDSRYQIALGRILTYDPKTRGEGRKYLERHPDDPQATEALRQSLLWDSQNPASSGEIRAYLAKHPDDQLALALRTQPKTGGGRPAVQLTAEQKAAQTQFRARSADEQAAYKALNAKHIDEAETRFKAILAANPDNPNALAGMGYIRMQQANFGGAISFLVQAKQDGSKDPGVEPALATSRFWSTMGEGAMALNANDLPEAEKQYRAALAMRPNSPEALEGLGGTLLKAQQPEPAIPIYVQFVKIKPAAPNAWRGLFIAQANSGDNARALNTEKHFPKDVRAQLMKDPLFLRSLASSYTAAGRDADAQTTLRVALDLPFPADARGVEAETRMQYASVLLQANHLDQAAGLYRQVLAQDQTNAGAWQGLIRVEHAMNQDPQAIQTLESMPPATYEAAMHDPGFETTVASIYQDQRKYDVAQDLLEKAIAQQTTAGQKPSVAIQIQLAGLYLQRDNPQQAYPIYQQVLSENPDRLDAWKGLLGALHSTNRDTEALAQVQEIPPPVRAQLENDVDFLQVVGSIYNGLGQPQQAALFLNRVKQHYIVENTLPPADVDIQNAWLLYNGGNDAGLYRQLMTIGSRPDLSDEQRRTVQTIWTNWAVRRANQAAAAGNRQRSLAILNAAARAFPDNPGVIKALAGGYSSAGQYKQAVAIWRSQNLTTASASDYKAAVGAALAANDMKDAETWLRFGLDQYPKDAEMLNLGAKFEQARGDTNRAITYYRASVDAMPPADPGAELATALSQPVSGGRLPNGMQSQDLSTLLKPGALDANGMAAQPPVEEQPYLPSYTNSTGNAPVTINGTGVVPSYMASPTPRTPAQTTTPRTRLKDYVPQASADIPVPMDGTENPSEVASNDGSPLPVQPVLSPAVYQQQQIARLTEQIAPRPAVAAPAPAVQMAMLSGQEQAPPQPQELPANTQYQPYRPYVPSARPLTATPQPSAPTADVYGPYVPYQPPPSTSVKLGQTVVQPAGQQSEVTDVLPKARYMPNAKAGASATSSHPDIAAANAAAIRRRQSNPNALTGRSTPPPDDYNVAPTENTAYGQATTQFSNQVAQPTTNQQQTTNQNQQTTNQNQQTQSPTFQGPARQQGDSYGQQYPQPNTTYRAPTTRSRVRRAAKPAPVVVETQPSGPVLSYPGVGTPLGAQPYPVLGQNYPLGQAPTDADLVAKRVPALRGYDPNALLEPAQPMTPRQQTERDLATLEASYSGWFGGTGSGRYRSGTPGIDRLTDLETTVEASATVGNGVRFTIVPKAVFLNSGVLNVANYTGQSSIGVPIIGSLSANATTAPSQQFASGVGGELQATARTFALSVGYTPYDFLVENVTAHGAWKPNQHFGLFFDRDSVKETQLSYAGLRDPGQATAVNPGPVWGGVVSTGGGVRFDKGDEKAGFYITADGADLTGYHVLDNYKFEGSMGAYFLAHTFPGYGKLNIGGSLFGMHYGHNERGETYGLGGYFSPDAYFLAAVPVTFTGYYKTNFHYTVAGNVGVQTFQEDYQVFFPLDPGLETSFRNSANAANPVNGSSSCTIPQIATHVCGESPVNSNTGFNYGLNAEASYRVADHWYVGGFMNANNTNNYNTISGGFFVRYLFRPQYPTESYPTGIFPVDGFRPLRVP